MEAQISTGHNWSPWATLGNRRRPHESVLVEKSAHHDGYPTRRTIIVRDADVATVQTGRMAPERKGEGCDWASLEAWEALDDDLVRYEIRDGELVRVVPSAPAPAPKPKRVRRTR